MATFSMPHTVKAVSVSASEFMMLVPPYIEQHGLDEDKALAKELLRITKEIRVLLGQFFLYTAMTRSKEFANTCDMSDAKEGAAIVVGSLMRTMVVTIAALFDDDPRTSNIPKMVRTALDHARCEFSFAFHKHYGVEAAAHKSRERLVKYGRAIRTRNLQAAIRRLIRVRNTFVAHIEFEPETLPNNQRAIVRDFDHVISAASVIVKEANVFVLGRTIDVSGLRAILRSEASGLVTAIAQGASSSKSPALL